MNAIDKRMNKESFFVAALNGDKRRVKKFLDRGFSAESKDDRGKTPLYLACVGGHAATVSLLIERLADSNSRCCDGSTPVHMAGLFGNIKILTKLINAGGDLRFHDYKCRSVYEWASKNPDEKKKKKMQAFLMKQRLIAMSYSPNCKEMKLVADSNSSSCRQEDVVDRCLKANCTHVLPSVFSLGFGTMFFNGKKEIGVLASINLVAESSLKHDEYGCTYNNGPFMVMESMSWGDTKVTVKRLHTFPPSGGCVDLLIRECNYITKLRHSSIILLMGLCQTIQMDGVILIFERIHYGSLFSLIYIKAETLSAHEMCVILCQISDAVAFLHQRKLLHCCITSHAIHMFSRTSAKLGNFECMIDNDLEETPVALQSLLDNRYMNSCYNWMAPEVMAGNAVTEKSDLYSLTCVLWELIHGLPPWSGMDAADIEVEVLRNHSSIHIKDNIQNPFNCLLQYGLARDITERQLSVSQLRDVLHGFIMDEDSEVIHHMASTSLSMDPGDPASVCNTDLQPEIRESMYREVSVSDDEVSCSLLSDVDLSKPWSLEETNASNGVPKAMCIPPPPRPSVAEISDKKCVPSIDAEAQILSAESETSVNDATLKCQDSHNSRDISTQTFPSFKHIDKVNISDEDDEPKPEILTPEHLKTDYPKSSTPNKIPMSSLAEDSNLKITDEDIAKVFSAAETSPVLQKASSPELSTENKTCEVSVIENIEKVNKQKPFDDIPRMPHTQRENTIAISVKQEASLTDVCEDTKDEVTESDSRSQLESKSRFSILSFLSSRSSKKSTDQDSTGDKDGTSGKSLKKTKKKSSERTLRHKKTTTESSDDQVDSQYVRNTAKMGFFAGKKIRRSRSTNEKTESSDKTSETSLHREKMAEPQHVPSNEELHARLGCYKIDISGIDKLDTEGSSKTHSEIEEVRKLDNIPVLKINSSCQQTLTKAESSNGDASGGNPFKKFVTADYDDIFTDEIKAILAKPMKMPKLPSQYSKTSLYSRSSIEKKPPSMAQTLMRLYSPTNCHTNMRSFSHHASATEKASSLPLFSASHRGFTSPRDADRSLSSVHSSRCDSSHLDASGSNTSSLTVKPASHHVPKISPFTSRTEHFAFPKSPRENTQPGSVSAHAVLLKELQNYHKTCGSSVSGFEINNTLAKKGGMCERVGNIDPITVNKLQSGLAHQTSTIVSPRQSYLTKPAVSSLRSKDEENIQAHQQELSQKVEKGWTGPTVAKAKFFGLEKPHEKLRSDTLVYIQQRSDRTVANRSQTPTRSSTKQYAKSFTLPRVSGVGVHATRIHSVKDMTAIFQNQLEDHFRKQAILVKKKKEGIPDGLRALSSNTFITPKHLKYQTLPARLNHVQVHTAIGDHHQPPSRNITSQNIELQKLIGVKPSDSTSLQKDSDGSFLNTSTICEQAYSRQINAESPAKCNRSSDENDEELCSFLEDLINTTHDEVVQEYADKDCIHVTPVKPSTDVGNAPCKMNFCNSNNAGPGDLCEVSKSAGSCDSGSANRLQMQRKRTSDELSISRKSNGDIEEFYFDDVIHPDLWKERHMRLQSTVALDNERHTVKSTDSSIVQLLDFDQTQEEETPMFLESAVSSGRFKLSRKITHVTEDEAEDTDQRGINDSNNSDVVDV